MKGFHFDREQPQLDITEPDGPVEITIQANGVVFVHCEGKTVLRVCRVKQFLVDDQRTQDQRTEQAAEYFDA
jgi:hypothetical protein